MNEINSVITSSILNEVEANQVMEKIQSIRSQLELLHVPTLQDVIESTQILEYDDEVDENQP